MPAVVSLTFPMFYVNRSHPISMIFAIAFRLDAFDEAGWIADPTLLEASFIAWTQSELNYSIISATIPSFQNFLKNLNTQFGGLGVDESGYGDGSASGSRAHRGNNQSFHMSKLRTTNGSRMEAEEEDYDIGVAKSGGDVGQEHGAASNTSAATVNDGKGADATSIASDESQRMMIRKDITWHIVSETR